MRTMMTTSMIVAFFAALALATGCEDSLNTAGEDFGMTVVASPSSLTFQAGETELTSQVFATIVDDKGVPQRGLGVLFVTTSGALASDGQDVTTDSNGRASDLLTVSITDPAQITVTAISGSLSKTVLITNASGVCATNTAPTARIVPGTAHTFPAGVVNTQTPNLNLDGATSTDLQNGIRSYSWDCGNGTALQTTPAATCAYTYLSTAKNYTVKLTVTDNGLVGHETECALSAQATVAVTVPLGTAVP